ncbi:VOC family protein [Kribbella sp. NPDC051770]|uniref:VOC family protein n=1 Tax=Kribbella sp. NPDC051770 TaxID=3155413 RepID=UPI00342BC96B
MTLQRMENVGIVVDDLTAAVAFFTELGLTLEGEGEVVGGFADQCVGLDGVHCRIAMMKVPDGPGRLELSQYLSPVAAPAPQKPPHNIVGTHRVMFSVTDIEDVVARLRPLGGELAGQIAQYGDTTRLCYLRGPSGIFVGLAEEV